MIRNLDITTLRSFVAVADSGGVTRAAGFLHLTQSAVSMQLKRLEELLGVALFDRSGRSIALTTEGEHLLGYARRMVQLNDEVIRRLTDQAFEGTVTLGVPHDIVYPGIPQVLKQFHHAYPRVNVQLISSNTIALKNKFERGGCDLILTTEIDVSPEAEVLAKRPLGWVGAPGGTAWRSRPLRVAFERQCSFRPQVIEALDRANIKWENMVDTDSDRTIQATVSADLAVHTSIVGTEPPQLERIDHGGALPELPMQMINLYGSRAIANEMIDSLVNLLRTAFSDTELGQFRAA